MTLPRPIPHPLAWWADAPDFVRWGLDLAVGAHWPGGDEERVWDLADGWLAVTQRMIDPVADVGAGMVLASEGFGAGDTAVGQALLDIWRDLGGDPDAVLPVLRGALEDIGHALAAAGADIEAAKLEVYVALGILAIELLGVVASAFLTFGASSTAAGPAVAATRLTIHEVLRRTVERMLRRAASLATKKAIRSFATRTAYHTVREGAEETFFEYCTESYQVHDGTRDSVSTRRVAAAGLAGAAGGSVGGLAAFGPHATTTAGRLGERLTRAAVGEALAETGAALATGNLSVDRLPDLGPG
jgi:hypothetical protein